MRNSDVILKCNKFKPFPSWRGTWEGKRRTVCTKLQKKKTQTRTKKNKKHPTINNKNEQNIILSQSHRFHGLTHDYSELMVGNISRFMKPFQLNITISLIYGTKSLPSKQIPLLLYVTEASGCTLLENLALCFDRKYGRCHDSGIFKKPVPTRMND